MRKQLIRKEIPGEGGGSVVFWVNPPSGHVRRLRRATAALNVAGLPSERPTTAIELQDVLDKAEKAFAADDDVWRALLGFVDSWTLTGWGETGEPLPVNMTGLDMLDEPMRQAVLVALSAALEDAAQIDPQTGAPSSSTAPADSAPSADSEREAAPVNVVDMTSSTTNPLPSSATESNFPSASAG